MSPPGSPIPVIVAPSPARNYTSANKKPTMLKSAKFILKSKQYVKNSPGYFKDRPSTDKTLKSQDKKEEVVTVSELESSEMIKLSETVRNSNTKSNSIVDSPVKSLD